MTFISKKHLSRRTFLRGAGVTLALPFLESMVPAGTALRLTAATPKTRFGCIYVPHGATMYKWTPATEGRGFEFSEILLPLEPFRNQLTVVSNLSHASAAGADAGAEHARSAAIYLSGGKPQRNAVRLGVTVDQVAARHIGQDTPLPSVELGIEEPSLSCGAGYGCAYFNTISWLNETTPLPVESSPQALFETLFGDGGTPSSARARRLENRSILDSIREQTVALRQGLPPADRVRVDGYLEDIREIERRIATVLEWKDPDVVPDAPVGTPEAFEDHLRLMFDRLTIAYQSETTRVSTLMYAKDLSPASYPASGNRGGFHGASHHGNVRERMDQFALINTYHVRMFTHFVEKLAATPDGDGTLLDHSMQLYGSSMSTITIRCRSCWSVAHRDDCAAIATSWRPRRRPRQPAPQHARYAGRARRQLRRQHRTARDLIGRCPGRRLPIHAPPGAMREPGPVAPIPGVSAAHPVPLLHGTRSTRSAVRDFPRGTRIRPSGTWDPGEVETPRSMVRSTSAGR
jgi:hypothetical protein